MTFMRVKKRYIASTICISQERLQSILTEDLATSGLFGTKISDTYEQAK